MVAPLRRPIAAREAAPPPVDPAADEARLRGALARLQPQRPGVVDAYVVVVALDVDPVFGREAREAGRVLARRFDAAGRTLVLAEDEGDARADAPGGPRPLERALARAGALMDSQEDVLVLYTTSHGTRDAGLAYRDPRRGMGVIRPADLASKLRPFPNRLVLLQACYSGQFVRALAGPRAIVATAASATRSSFGCEPGNDWTFWGDALLNRALRKPGRLPAQLAEANEIIAGWEGAARLTRSLPQVSIGADAARWLDLLEARAPDTASAPVGRSPARAPGLR